MKRLAVNILIATCMAWTVFSLATVNYKPGSLWIAAAAIAGFIASVALYRWVFPAESRTREDTAR